jgi:hypothetical protein
MRKVKCFSCHNMGNYVGQCTNKKGGKKTQSKVDALENTQMDEFCKKFE